MPGNMYVPGTGIPSENYGTLFDSCDLAIPGKMLSPIEEVGFLDFLNLDISNKNLHLHLDFQKISTPPSKIYTF